MKKLIFFLIAQFALTLIINGQNFDSIKKIAEQGNAKAQYNLGYMYIKGNGVSPDTTKAFYWFKKSAEQGNALAQYNLALMYYYGQGTLTDKKQAAYWMRKAYDNGFQEAKDMWDKLELWKYESN